MPMALLYPHGTWNIPTSSHHRGAYNSSNAAQCTVPDCAIIVDPRCVECEVVPQRRPPHNANGDVVGWMWGLPSGFVENGPMENMESSWVFPLKTMIFHTYFKLPSCHKFSHNYWTIYESHDSTVMDAYHIYRYIYSLVMRNSLQTLQ